MTFPYLPSISFQSVTENRTFRRDHVRFSISLKPHYNQKVQLALQRQIIIIFFGGRQTADRSHQPGRIVLGRAPKHGFLWFLVSMDLDISEIYFKLYTGYTVFWAVRSRR